MGFIMRALGHGLKIYMGQFTLFNFQNKIIYHFYSN
ncbi:MAG: hypothetical protein WBG30_02560 [Psychrilyobacter sp.]